MATPTNIVKFLIRRGSNTDRKQVVLAQGELGVTTDGQNVRLFVGDGVTLGGKTAATKFYIIQSFTDYSTLQYVENGDILFNLTDNHLYAFTGINTGSNLAAISASCTYIGR